MIIDRKTKELLDLLISSTPDKPRNSFSYDWICELSGLDEAEMFVCVKQLVKLELAEYAYRSTTSSRKDVGIALTQSGLRYKEIGKLERLERWKERLAGFIIGILTSVIGAVIIEWLTR